MKRLLIALALALFAVPAVAAPCGGYPYTLTNGQTADATQVMGNFNAVLNCLTANAAANGSNTDITALSGLTTPLSIPQGGTGGTSGATALSALGGLQSSLNLTDVQNALTALSNLGGVAKVNNGSDFASISTTLNNLLPAQASASGKCLQSNGTTAAWGACVVGVAEFQEQETSGSGSSCSITASTWSRRILNATVGNTIPGLVSASGNQITMLAGTYIIEVNGGLNISSSPGKGRLRIYDTTDSLAYAGPGSYVAVGTDVNVVDHAAVVISATKVFEIDTWITAGAGTCGSALSTGANEVYTDILIEKIA
jgi:hypothetical protein